MPLIVNRRLLGSVSESIIKRLSKTLLIRIAPSKVILRLTKSFVRLFKAKALELVNFVILCIRLGVIGKLMLIWLVKFLNGALRLIEIDADKLTYRTRCLPLVRQDLCPH